MNEDQARKKWCPAVRELGDDGASYNRDYSGKPVGRCIASDCMAWQFVMVGGSPTKSGYCGLTHRRGDPA